MSLNRFFILAITASFVVFGHIRTTIADDITVDQLLGTWYNVATALDEFRISCSKLTITRGDCNKSFTAVITTVYNGDARQIEAKGKIENSQLRISYPGPIYRQIVYEVATYNNGQELTLYNYSYKLFDLYSRTTSVSNESMRIFRNTVARVHLPFTEVEQTGCP